MDRVARNHPLATSRCCSSLDGRSGAGLVNSVIALSKFILILSLKAINSASTVELSTQHFICLNETLELASQICVLSLEALSMLLKGISLGEEVTVVGAVLLGGDS